ncbi:UPF0182 family protein [Candidatus Poribacteria bacterium]|nr:UPF0182 family protein [Candidatus Poribacteria bacterium]
MSSTSKKIIVVIIVLAAIIIGLRIWASIYPEWLWFNSESLDFASVFLTILRTRIALGFGFGILFLALTAGNFYLLWRFVLSKSLSDDDVIPIIGGVAVGKNLLIAVILIICVIFGTIAGSSAATYWEPYLRYIKSDQISFSQIAPETFKDPIFNKDIAYYVFKMPFLRFVRGWLFMTFFFITIATGGVYLLFGGSKDKSKGRLAFSPRAHLFSLAAITMLLLAWGRLFAMYELLATETTVRHGWVYGVGYADHVARIPVHKVMMAVAILTAVVFLVGIFVRKLTWIAVGGIALYLIVSFFGGLMVPWVVQRFQVDPQEFNKEEPYIAHNIEYTRKAYNLDNIEEKAYRGTGNLTLEDITQNKAVMQNIRLWDWRPLRDTFKQREARRPQYDFVDVDIDRYMIGGQVRQVMLSARELIFSKVENRTWINRTFFYTHGHGLTMIPVSEIETGGLPRMYINDIPPKIHDPWTMNIERPEIYYGEGERASFRSEHGILPYIVVDPKSEEPGEFDYPREGKDALTKYIGKGGIPIDSFWRKLAFAFKFSDDMRNILFSGDITSTSKIMMHRSISERVRVIAPFLKYDKDPYLVVSNGRLFWIQDAYTTTHMYPYSEPMIEETTEVMQYGQQRGYRTRRKRIWGNYIRNSVKVVIDAYDGTVKFYSMIKEDGQEDPIAECYQRMFPDLFTDFRQMPDDLKQHIRYPLTMFMIQAEKYTKYHMNNPRTFYSKEDLWQVSTEKYQTASGETAGEQPVEPYYVILQLPGSEKEEFMLMLPFTPSGKKNMIAWLAAKCDPGEDGNLGEYSNLLVYNFPKGELVDGTIQIEAYIDQKEEMSEQLSLWSQRGSNVLRGNLLAIPIKQSMLYVEPIYLQAEAAAIPQLKRVVVAQGGRLEWGEDLESALGALYNVSIPTIVSDTVTEAEEPIKVEPVTRSQRELANKALERYNRAQEYIKSGDWARYGQEMKKLKETLQMLQATTPKN